MTENKFSGIWTALITPFYEGKVDFHSIEKLITEQVQRGVDGFVISGTTGESPTLTTEEKIEIFKFVRSKLSPEVKLIFGIGTNSTAGTLNELKNAERISPDAFLVVVPYYNKPPQRGLVAHFGEIAKATELPIILYNVPSRTVCSLDVASIKELAENKNIIGIKEASGNLDFDRDIRKNLGPQFTMLSGDDGTFDDFMKIPGDGVISVASHIIPEAFKNRNVGKYKTLVDQLFSEANPIPLKAALYILGKIRSPELRLPLMASNKTELEKMRFTLQQAGLLK